LVAGEAGERLLNADAAGIAAPDPVEEARRTRIIHALDRISSVNSSAWSLLP
jgi:hypothetical protein